MEGLAVITGASTGIGYELARCCAKDGYDVIVCADEPAIRQAAEKLREEKGVSVEAVEADLGTEDGIEALMRAIGDKPVEALLANAGRGLGDAFLDQDLEEAKEVVNVNVLGTISLIQKVGRRMRDRNSGKILITGSIAGSMPGSYQAVYNASKSFLGNFSYALGNELKDTGVTVTCLMPGPTDTEFFNRARMQRTPVGKDDDKASPAKVAEDGYAAMQRGEAGIVSGFKNKVQDFIADVTPPTVTAEMHRKIAKPEQ